MNLYFSFRSRTQSINFSRTLTSYGIQNKIISTPKQISSECGLSVIMPYSALNTAQSLLGRNYNTFIGAYKLSNGYLTAIIVR